MAVVVVVDSHWVQVMDPDVHVCAGLDVVLGNAHLLELLCSTPHRSSQANVLLRHPASLHPCPLLFVPLLLLVLAVHGRDRFDGLLKLNLLVVPGRKLVFDEFRLSS